MIVGSLQKYEGNRRLAAQALKISERTLYRKIKEYGSAVAMQTSKWKIRTLDNVIILILFTFNFSLLIFLSGCAYSFSGSSVPKHLKTIAIPLFEDQSGFGEPGLKENFTTSVDQSLCQRQQSAGRRSKYGGFDSGGVDRYGSGCAVNHFTRRTSNHAAGDNQRARDVSRFKTTEEGLGKKFFKLGGV